MTRTRTCEAVSWTQLTLMAMTFASAIASGVFFLQCRKLSALRIVHSDERRQTVACLGGGGDLPMAFLQINEREDVASCGVVSGSGGAYARLMASTDGREVRPHLVLRDDSGSEIYIGFEETGEPTIMATASDGSAAFSLRRAR